MKENLNQLTVESLIKSARGEEVHRAADAEELFVQLDIQDSAERLAQSVERFKKRG